MIILELKKCNSKFQKNLSNYKELLNYGCLECPFCHSSNIIRWGSYERNVIYFDNEGKTLKSELLSIQRIKCKSCNKTHALLPEGIIPYKQFTMEVISKGLDSIIKHTSKQYIDQYMVDESILIKWWKQFKEKHLGMLKTTFPNYKVEDAIKYKIFDEQEKYIKQNNCCFMQIKLSIIGLRPS